MGKLIQLLVLEEISRLEELSLEMDGVVDVSKFDNKANKLKNGDFETTKELINYKMAEISGAIKCLEKTLKESNDELNSLQEEYFKFVGIDI